MLVDDGKDGPEARTQELPVARQRAWGRDVLHNLRGYPKRAAERKL